MRSFLPARLAQWTAVWNRIVAGWRWRAFIAAIVLALFGGAHVARIGSSSARLAVALTVAGLIAIWAARALWLRLEAREPRRRVRRILRTIDPRLGDKAARAVGLNDAVAQQGDSISIGLARLHLDTLLSRVSVERFEQNARKRARIWKRAGLLFAALALAAVIVGPLRVVEGLDVLVARSGRAPIPLEWVDRIIWEAQIPRYLRQGDRLYAGFGTLRLPQGSLLVVHARPAHDDRPLVLTNGTTDTPFVDDGQGGRIAHWSVTNGDSLQVAARFGEVLIPQGDRLELESIPDQLPKVVVQDTPRIVKLIDVQEIQVFYDATDDHGLTQVDLVLRSGDREQRRVLVRPEGQRKLDRGSSVVRPMDRFVRDAYLPVEITVEARDNDPITGPKWGRSEAITLVPPAVGEGEALRAEALRRVRDAAVDLLAKRITFEVPSDSAHRQAHVRDEREAHDALLALIQKNLKETFAGLRVPSRVSVRFKGQTTRLEKAIRDECPPSASRGRCKKGHDATVEKTKQAVLLFDSGLRWLATRDATRIAKQLSEAAEEAAAGAKTARQGDGGAGRAKLKVSMDVLRTGGRSLSRLEDLGKDLGEVVDIGLRRMDRALLDEDLTHTELAARHLAARLRRPFPSFTGQGVRRGTEAGGMTGSGSASGDASMQEAFSDGQSDLDGLAREHAAEMDRLRRDLAEAEGSMDLSALQDMAREHAARVREAIRGLPSVAFDAASVQGAASLVRQNGERMADALDRVGLADASNSGRNALNAAERANQLAETNKDFFGGRSPLTEEVNQARRSLEQELKWVDEQLKNLRKATADQARDSLDRAAKNEDEFAQRAGQLAEQGRTGSAPLPESATHMLDRAKRAMQDAARALREADAHEGLSQQQEAQRLLEMVRESDPDERESDSSPRNDGDGSKNAPGGERIDIPKADQFKGPEAFRKRVLEGLGKTSDPRLRDAVRRYAEGLLR